MKRGGFTLVEVLAALAVLAIALFVLLDAHYNALRLNSTLNDEVINRELLETAVARAEVEVLLGNLGGGGEFGPRYPDHTWSFDAVRQAGGGAGMAAGGSNIFTPSGGAAAGGRTSNARNVDPYQDIKLYEVTVRVTGPDAEEQRMTFLTYNVNPETNEDGMFNANTGGAQPRTRSGNAPPAR
jgi:prepilin-type N-terminal cleavage/methylation domain-containing protein